LFFVFLVLKFLEEFEQNYLRNLTTSSFQISEISQSEVSIELVGHRIEWLAHS
jgi:hypothetical protein